MKRNMGITDRLARVLVAVAIGVLYLTNTVAGVLAIVLLILAAILVLTSLIGFCPLYFTLGSSTKKDSIEEYSD